MPHKRGRPSADVTLRKELTKFVYNLDSTIQELNKDIIKTIKNTAPEDLRRCANLIIDTVKSASGSAQQSNTVLVPLYKALREHSEHFSEESRKRAAEAREKQEAKRARTQQPAEQQFQ